MGCRVRSRERHRLIEPRCREGGLHPVHFRQHDLEGHRRLVEQLHHRAVGGFRLDARIQEQHDPPERRPPTEVVEHQPLPVLLHRERRLRIAVARHVHEREPPAEVEEIKLLRMPGPPGGARERLPPRQRVDERGFSNIRPAGERHFRPRRLRQLIEPLRPVEELALGREQDAAGFEVLAWDWQNVGALPWTRQGALPLATPLTEPRTIRCGPPAAWQGGLSA
jgi:hypothetical protein